MKHSIVFVLLACLWSGAADADAAGAPRVVASVRPLHSLVTGVMAGVAAPELLVRGASSPHGYQLKPSDRRMLGTAEIVFYIDARFETFLGAALESLPGSVRPIALAGTLPLLPLRRGGVWEGHGHAHARVPMDYHVWLDPGNAVRMATAIEAALSARYPDHATAFRRNTEALIKKLKALDAALARKLAGVKGKPFIVFHDAYRYFENRYGLNGIGSLTLHPETPPSAADLAALRKKIIAGSAICVFKEPQYSDRLVESITEGTSARTATLDPMEYATDPGEGFYFTAMEKLADALVGCLGQTSAEKGN